MIDGQGPDIVKGLLGTKDLNNDKTGDGLANGILEVNERFGAIGGGRRLLLDKEWGRLTFMTSNIHVIGAKVSANEAERLNATDFFVKNRFFTSADNKFIDTRMGGGIALNQFPQWCRYSDVRVKGRVADRVDVSPTETTGNNGLGRYWSDALDDSKRQIHIRAGIPKHNPITSFISTAYDPAMSSYARTGKGLSVWRKGAEAIATVARWVFFPLFSAAWAGIKLAHALLGPTSSKFYYLQPTMPNYWSSVQLLVNAMAVNAGVTPRFLNPNEDKVIGAPFTLDVAALNKLEAMLNGDFKADTGHISVFNIVTRTQRLANTKFKADYLRMHSAAANQAGFDYTGLVKDTNDTKLNHPPGSKLSDWFKYHVMTNAYMQQIFEQKDGLNSVNDPNVTEGIDKDSGLSALASGMVNGTIAKDLLVGVEHFTNFIDAEFTQGSQFVSFNVENDGTTGLSLSNSYRESDLAAKFNEKASSAREAKFNFANFELTGTTAESMLRYGVGAVADMAKGASDGFFMGITKTIEALVGGGYVDVPQHWQSSSANLPKMSYTISCVSPSRHPFALLQNIYLPVAACIALAAPLSTGKQSYTAPFICELYDQARGQSKLCAVQSMSVTHGTSNLPYNKAGKMMACEITMEFLDLSSIFHMPVPGPVGLTEILLDPLNPHVWTAGTIDSDSPLMDYLAVLTGQDMNSQIYPWPRAISSLAKTVAGIGRVQDAGWWAMQIHEELTSGIMSYVPGIGTVGLAGLVDGFSSGVNVNSR